MIASMIREKGKLDAQRCKLALTYIMTSVDDKCKPLIIQLRCSRKPCKALFWTLPAMSEPCVDAKLNQLQNLRLQISKNIVGACSTICPNREARKLWSRFSRRL